MSKSGRRPALKKQSDPVTLMIKLFVIVAMIATFVVVGWALRARKTGKRSESQFPSYLSVTPEALDFGSAPYGKPVVRKLRIANKGRNMIFLSKLVSSSTEFYLHKAFPGMELNRGECFDAVVIFRPGFPGTITGKLTIESSDVGRDNAEVPCTGYCRMPRVEVDPDSLDFGNIQQAGVRAVRTIHIKNTGTADLTLSAVRVDSKSFDVEGSLPAGPLSPGGAVRLDVVFRPVAAGSNDSVLRIYSSDPVQPQIAMPIAAAYLQTQEKGRRKQAALAQIKTSKQKLAYAYMNLHSRATSEKRREELRLLGAQEFQKAWPLYQQANEELRRIDPSLVDTEYYVENGRLERR